MERKKKDFNEGTYNALVKVKEDYEYQHLKLKTVMEDPETTPEVVTMITKWMAEVCIKHVEHCGKLGALSQKIKVEPKPFTNESPRTSSTQLEALKPSILTRSTTMEEFDVWKSQFSSYYNLSGMENWENKTQRDMFLTCIDPAVQLDIQRFITDEITIYGTDGLMKKLEESFDD